MGVAVPPTLDASAMQPWTGLWTYARLEDEAYEHVLAQQGLPWAVRKLLQAFTAQREFVVDSEGFLFRSKMLTGSWSELRPNIPTLFSILGYSIDTLVTWENDGHTLVSTMTTTAAEGYFTSGWTATTRIEHTLEDGELVIKTIAPEGTYLMWMERSKA